MMIWTIKRSKNKALLLNLIACNFKSRKLINLHKLKFHNRRILKWMSMSKILTIKELIKVSYLKYHKR